SDHRHLRWLSDAWLAPRRSLGCGGRWRRPRPRGIGTTRGSYGFQQGKDYPAGPGFLVRLLLCLGSMEGESISRLRNPYGRNREIAWDSTPRPVVDGGQCRSPGWSDRFSRTRVGYIHAWLFRQRLVPA